MVSSNAKQQPSLGQQLAYNITSSIPGRLRVQLSYRPGRHELLTRWADWLQTATFFQRIQVSVHSGSLILHYSSRKHTLQQVKTFLSETAIKAQREKPPKLRQVHDADNAFVPSHIIDKSDDHASFVKSIKANDIHSSRPFHSAHMVAPTIAVV